MRPTSATTRGAPGPTGSSTLPSIALLCSRMHSGGCDSLVPPQPTLPKQRELPVEQAVRCTLATSITAPYLPRAICMCAEAQHSQDAVAGGAIWPQCGALQNNRGDIRGQAGGERPQPTSSSLLPLPSLLPLEPFYPTPSLPSILLLACPPSPNPSFPTGNSLRRSTRTKRGSTRCRSRMTRPSRS